MNRHFQAQGKYEVFRGGGAIALHELGSTPQCIKLYPRVVFIEHINRRTPWTKP